MCVLWCLVFSDKRCAESSWITAAETWGDKNIVSGNTDSAYYILRSLFSQDDPNSFQEIDKKKKRWEKGIRLVGWLCEVYSYIGSQREILSLAVPKRINPFPNASCLYISSTEKLLKLLDKTCVFWLFWLKIQGFFSPLTQMYFVSKNIFW